MNLDKQRMGWIDRPAILGGVPYVVRPWPEYKTIGKQELDAVVEVMEHGILSGFQASTDDAFLGGPAVRALEAAWTEKFEIKHAIAMNSATSALMAAFSACEIGPGDEVILDPVGMSGAAAAILANSAIPIFVDVDPETMNLDPDAVATAITPRTKAICIVHHGGLPAPMDTLNELAKKRNLFVVEDNAQAIGASYHDKYTGTIGHIGVFSLNRNKIIQCGEGGVAVTNDDDLAKRLQLIRNHGEALLADMKLDSSWNLIGYNLRMTELQAAIAIEQLAKLDDLLAARIRLANNLTRRIQKDFDFLTAPPVSEEYKHVYSCFRIGYNEEATGLPLSMFAEAVQMEGVPIEIGRPEILYHQPIYQDRSARGTSGYPFGKRWYDGDTRYDSGLCPTAEALPNRSLFIDSMVRPPNASEDMDRILDTFAKIYLFREDILNWNQAGRPEDKSAYTVKTVPTQEKKKEPRVIETPALKEEEIATPETEEVVESDQTFTVILGAETLESATTLAPVAEMLLERLDVDLRIAVAGQAVSVFKERFRTEFEVFDTSDGQDLNDSMNEWLKTVQPHVVLTGLTGAMDNLEYTIQHAAKSQGIKTTAVLDSWSRFTERLQDPDTEQPFAYLPDKYGISDFTTALEHAGLGVQKQHLQLVGHPFHNDLKRSITQWRIIRERARRWLDVHPSMDLVVFFSEPLADLIDNGLVPDPGYHEFDGLNTTAAGLALLYGKHACVLAVKEQPDNRSFGDRLEGGEIGGVHVVDVTDSPLSDLEWILAADAVVGMASPQLVHSACAGIQTLVVQPNLIRSSDRNPLTRRGLTANLETAEDVRNEIRTYDGQDKRSMLRIRKEFRWTEDAAANVCKMVVDLAAEATSTSK